MGVSVCLSASISPELQVQPSSKSCANTSGHRSMLLRQRSTQWPSGTGDTMKATYSNWLNARGDRSVYPNWPTRGSTGPGEGQSLISTYDCALQLHRRGSREVRELTVLGFGVPDKNPTRSPNFMTDVVDYKVLRCETVLVGNHMTLTGSKQGPIIHTVRKHPQPLQ